MLDNMVELFEDQLEVIKRINDLKKQGYEEDDMYIIVDDDEEISILKGFTTVMIKEEDDSLFDRFKSFLTGKDSIVDAFNKMDLDEKYRDDLYEEVQNGKILLMVNKNYESKFELTEEGLVIPIEDLETEKDGTIFDRYSEVDSEEPIPDNIRKDIGLEVSEESGDIDRLINSQITKDDFHDR